ncbi:NmrA family NAD(P)-binding protein [Paenibacillus sp. NPDC058071]|uniref:NmrA family NAD(P)-binding protein n=1 Tax=Paenibacillus sp. NPDC058071 TaxID=3346326 RepID=UPI0036DEBA19
MPIIITGANGKLGQLVIQRLVRSIPLDQIIACVRRAESAKSLEQLGVEVRLCDYDRPESLEQAFIGASKLLFISSSHPDDDVRLRQHIAVIEAAKLTKVEHLLYTSFAYPDNGSSPPVPLHLATEQAIRAAKIPFTFLRNALYIDFIGALDLNAAIEKGTLTVPPGEWRFNSAARSDLADAIAAVLTAPNETNRIYELTASTPWTFDDLVAALSDISGKSITLEIDPGIQHWIYRFLSRINTSSVSLDMERLMGRPAASLKENVASILSTAPGK